MGRCRCVHLVCAHVYARWCVLCVIHSVCDTCGVSGWEPVSQDVREREGCLGLGVVAPDGLCDMKLSVLQKENQGPLIWGWGWGWGQQRQQGLGSVKGRGPSTEPH